MTDSWAREREASPPVDARATRSRAQGADMVAHLTYFDKETQLSFVHDGQSREVAVSSGGYAEPVIDVFRMEFTLDGVGEVLNEFATACRIYVQAWATRGEQP